MSPEETAGFGGVGVRNVWCGGPAVRLQRGMDLWGDDAAFCQIILTSCLSSISHIVIPDAVLAFK